MYPNLYFLLKDLFGINSPWFKLLNSFGFMVALAFLTAYYLFVRELKRKEAIGLMAPKTVKVLKGAPVSTNELLFSALIGFVLGYKLLYIILHWNNAPDDPHAFLLSREGNLIGGIIAAAAMTYYSYIDKKKQVLKEPQWLAESQHPWQHVGNMTVIAAIAGLLGAKIFHNLENLQEFSADPIGSLLSFSGLTMYGGLICGSVAVIWYAKKNNMPILPLIDACAPGLMLAYAVGRVGCQIAGDGDWGIPNDQPMPSWLSFLPEWVWAYDYPNNVLNINLREDFINSGYTSLTGKAFPTPFYETVMCTVLFMLLWVMRKKIKLPGVLFCCYLIFNGVERFLIEKIRVNSTYSIAGLKITQAEIISIVLILIGTAGIVWLKQQQKKTNLS